MLDESAVEINKHASNCKVICDECCELSVLLSTCACCNEYCRSANKGADNDQARNLSASEETFKLRWREAHIKTKQVD